MAVSNNPTTQTRKDFPEPTSRGIQQLCSLPLRKQKYVIYCFRLRNVFQNIKPTHLNRNVNLFYDSRTLSLDKKELIEIFEVNGSDVYISIFERNFDDGLHVRIYNILYEPLIPTSYPIKIIQTRDDNNIYCQIVNTFFPSRFTDVITLDNADDDNKLFIWCYNLGLDTQDLSTEFQYWEFKGSRWTPCEITAEITPGHTIEEYYVGDEKRSSLNITVYLDGIAFYNSVFGSDKYRYDKIEKNKNRFN